MSIHPLHVDQLAFATQQCPLCLEQMEPVVGAWWCPICNLAVDPQAQPGDVEPSV